MKPNLKQTRPIFHLVLLFSLLLASLSTGVALRQEPASQRGSKQAKRALVISIDGLDARYLAKRDEYGLKIPTLRRLMAEGLTAQGVRGVYPSVTYPSHTTIVTGTTPARHGIFGNEIVEPPDQPRTGAWHWFAREIKTDTLWDAAARNSLTTALISWPVAVGAGDYNVPEIFKVGGTRLETLAVMRENARPQGLLQEVAAHDPDLYKNVNADESDDLRTRYAEYVIKEKRPELLLIHLFDLDHFQHSFGPFTPEAFAILEKEDAYVARLLAAQERAGVMDETAVFIVSDHGFLPITKLIHPGVLLARAGLIKVHEERDAQGRAKEVVTEWRAMPYVTSGSCAIILRDPKDKEALKLARSAFADLMHVKAGGKLKENPLLGIVDANVLRRIGSNTDAAFMLEATDGYAFGTNYTGEVVTPSKALGQHGYFPSRYAASFIASGAGVTRRGALKEISMTDIGPTIARTLGLKLRDAEGQAIKMQ
ncbi:MAG: ectonucleotide pyrophosphatase/phosphodiesterase [Pyrinomonadaceae bacterium]